MTQLPGIAEEQARRRQAPSLSWIEWGGLLGAATILIAFRLHAFDLPLETDECNYAYIGAQLLDGDRIYVDVWDHQPFGVFVLFAGVMALFGDAPEVFRWMTVGFSLASLGLIFAIVRWGGHRLAAMMAAVLFALASSDPGTAGEGCNREIYMNTFILAGWYLALRSAGRPGGVIFFSGWALAIGSSLKTIVAVHWLFLALWIAWAAWHRKSAPNRGRAVVLSLTWFAAGPAFLWLAAGGFFALTDRFGEFFDAVFLFNVSYSEGGEGFLARFARFFAPQRHPFIFDSALPLWLGTIGAGVWLMIEMITRRSTQALAVWFLLLAGYVATCLPAHFWPHYYYLLIPPTIIAVSVAVACLVARPPRPETATLSKARRAAAIVLYAVFPIWLLCTQYRDYLNQPPFGITVKRYNSRDFWGRAHGENVRRVTDRKDTIFVFGNDTAIYYYSQRRCASRYTMITGLQAGYRGADQRRAIFMKELEKDPPRLILVLFDEPPFDEWKAFLDAHYGAPIGADRHDGSGDYIMFVFARKDHPIEEIDWDWDRSQVGGWLVGARRLPRQSGDQPPK